jgi:hypothetical protein
MPLMSFSSRAIPINADRTLLVTEYTCNVLSGFRPLLRPMDLNDAQVQQHAETDRREVDPPIEVQTATHERQP